MDLMMLLQAFVVFGVCLLVINVLKIIKKRRKQPKLNVVCPLVERPKTKQPEYILCETGDVSIAQPGKITAYLSDTSELPSKETMRHIKKIKAKSKRRSSKRVNKNKKLYNKSKK